MSDQRGTPGEVPEGSDETVVVPRAVVPEGDETVVVPRAVVPDVDETVAVPRAVTSEGDETVVVPRRPSPHFGPVEEPEPASSVSLTGEQPLSTRSVYSARSDARQSLLSGNPVQDPIGPVPAATLEFGTAPVARDQLPSVERRSKRRRVLTLAGYAGVLVVTVVGLTVVINMAFNGG